MVVVVVVVVWVFCAGCSGVVVVWGRVHKGAGRRAGAFFVAVATGALGREQILRKDEKLA